MPESADFEKTLLQYMQTSGRSINDVAGEIARVLASAPGELEKGQASFVKLALQALPAERRREAMLLAQLGRLDELRVRLAADLEKMAVRQAGTRAAEEAKVEGRIRLRGAEAEAAGQRKMATGRAEIRLEGIKKALARKEALRDPTLQPVRERIASIREEVSRTGPVNMPVLKDRIESVKRVAAEVPQLKTEVTLLEEAYDTKKADAVRRTKEFLLSRGVTSPAAQSHAVTEAESRGFALSPRDKPSPWERRVLREAQTIQASEQGILEAVRKGGFRLKGTTIPLEGGEFLQRTKPGVYSMLAPRAGLAEAEAGLQQAMRLATSPGTAARAPGAAAETMSLAQTAPKSKVLRRGGIAGAAALFLMLMQLLKGKKQETMSPWMQLQLQQQMSGQQLKQGLAHSLISSRAASAEQALARAQLLKLQALQAAGGSPASAIY